MKHRKSAQPTTRPIKNVSQKLDGRIRKAITQATTMASIDQLEYTLDWSNFPNSIKLQCYLLDDSSNALISNSPEQALLIKYVQQCFLKQGIKFRDFKKNISFRTALTQSNPSV